MTQNVNQGTSPTDETGRWSPPDEVRPGGTPELETTYDGPIVRREPVAGESGTFGAEAASGRRASGVRWAIALGGVALVVVWRRTRPGSDPD